jgi:AbrB family looped-hinge helix DNA binding protein
MNASTLTSKGQVTIPIELRHALNLHAGDHLVFELIDDKIQIFKKKNDITHAFAMYKVNKKVTLDDIQDAIEKGYTDDSN